MAKRRHPESDEIIIEVDSRRRCSLGRLGVKPGTLFLASISSDGTVTLEPAVCVSLNNTK